MNKKKGFSYGGEAFFYFVYNEEKRRQET